MYMHSKNVYTCILTGKKKKIGDPEVPVCGTKKLDCIRESSTIGEFSI